MIILFIRSRWFSQISSKTHYSVKSFSLKKFSVFSSFCIHSYDIFAELAWLLILAFEEDTIFLTLIQHKARNFTQHLRLCLVNFQISFAQIIPNLFRFKRCGKNNDLKHFSSLWKASGGLVAYCLCEMVIFGCLHWGLSVCSELNQSMTVYGALSYSIFRNNICYHSLFDVSTLVVEFQVYEGKTPNTTCEKRIVLFLIIPKNRTTFELTQISKRRWFNTDTKIFSAKTLKVAVDEWWY